MAFKGGKKYPTAKAVSESLDSIGAEDNASTGQEYTNYYVRAAVNTLPKAVDVLADTLLTPALDPTEIERERGVIVEEINMYEDDPREFVNLLFNRMIFPGHPLGRDIAGYKKTVKEITRKDFVDFRKNYYLTKNILVTVSGGIQHKQAFELTNKYFGGLPKQGYQNIYKDYKEDQKKPEVVLEKRKTEQTNLMIGFPGNKHGQKTRYAEDLLGVILGAGMSSRLFREVRERRGLAYSVYAGSSHYQDTGEFSAYAGVPVGKAKEAVKVILEEFNKLTGPKHKLNSKELNKAKEFYKGHMALAMESTRWLSYFFGAEEMKGGKLKSPEEVFKALDKVTIEDVLSVAKEILVPQKVNLAVVGPYKDSSDFSSLL
jgi:predicted Zn-dependent peptidase